MNGLLRQIDRGREQSRRRKRQQQKIRQSHRERQKEEATSTILPEGGNTISTKEPPGDLDQRYKYCPNPSSVLVVSLFSISLYESAFFFLSPFPIIYNPSAFKAHPPALFLKAFL